MPNLTVDHGKLHFLAIQCRERPRIGGERVVKVLLQECPNMAVPLGDEAEPVRAKVKKMTSARFQTSHLYPNYSRISIVARNRSQQFANFAAGCKALDDKHLDEMMPSAMLRAALLSHRPYLQLIGMASCHSLSYRLDLKENVMTSPTPRRTGRLFDLGPDGLGFISPSDAPDSPIALLIQRCLPQNIEAAKLLREGDRVEFHLNDQRQVDEIHPIS